MVQSTAQTLAKGAIVLMPAQGETGGPSYVLFQFNPANLRRSLQPRMVGGEPGGHFGQVRFVGAPIEEFAMTIDVDAREQITPSAAANAVGKSGLYPALYALETALYPALSDVQANLKRLSQGEMGIMPYATRSTILVWGANRVVPVQLTSMTIAEQEFDADLNPIRASISLEARALSYSDVSQSAPGFQTFVSYQQLKERLGKLGQTSDGSATKAQL